MSAPDSRWPTVSPCTIDGRPSLQVLDENGRQTYSVAIGAAPQHAEWEKPESSAIRACLDHLAKRGYWPINGRAAIWTGPLPLVCPPIESVRAAAAARFEAYGLPADAEIVSETEDAVRTVEVETLRMLAAKYPDALRDQTAAPSPTPRAVDARAYLPVCSRCHCPIEQGERRVWIGPVVSGGSKDEHPDRHADAEDWLVLRSRRGRLWVPRAEQGNDA